MAKDFYSVLGVSKKASQDEIKKAHRKLVRQYHPDTNPDDKAAEERFKEINEAYEVLSDAQKRRKYDELGANYQQWQRAGGRPGEAPWQMTVAAHRAAGRHRCRPCDRESDR